MRKIYLALAISLALPSCAAASTAAAVVSAVTSPEPIGDRILMDERGLYAMEALYNVPASAYRSAVERRIMTPGIRAVVRPLLIRARGIRDAARTAYRVGDARSWDARIRELRNLQTEIMAQLPASN